MFEHLNLGNPLYLPAAKHRRLRLLACAACRRIWHLLDEYCREAIEIAERHADGLARSNELRAVRNRLEQRIRATSHSARDEGALAVFSACEMPPDGRWSLRCAANAVSDAQGEIPWPYESSGPTPYQAECIAQGHLIRDVYGESPNQEVSIPLAWYLRGGGALREIARAIYGERAFDRMPILGDALEEAGCDDADILAHCRSSTEHVRGCWVVDAILGKT
jgi:hypothetical protein